MEEIFADTEVTAAMVKEVVEALFPGLTYFEWDPQESNGGKIEVVQLEGVDTCQLSQHMIDAR